MKITKSELKSLIKEALKEELGRKPARKIKESLSQSDIDILKGLNRDIVKQNRFSENNIPTVDISKVVFFNMDEDGVIEIEFADGSKCAYYNDMGDIDYSCN